MENKILVQDLAEFLSQRNGMTKKKAEIFVRAFFDVILSGLEADKFVKIKGFGTFKMVSVGERESVNISTGERFQIQGHSKISFTPDNNLKDLVNRPFAHFQTVVLNEETSIEELESVSVDDLLDLPETINEEDMANELRELSEQLNVEDDPEFVHLVVDEAEDTLGKETSFNENDDINNPESIDHDSDVDGRTKQEVNADVDEQINLAEENEQPIAICPDEIDKSSEDQNTNEQKNENLLSNEVALSEYVNAEDANLHENESEQTKMADREIIEQKETITSPSNDNTRYVLCENTNSSFNWWKFMALSLLFVIMMVISYFVGYYRILCPCMFEQEESNIVVPTKVSEPTIIIDDDSLSTDEMLVADEVGLEVDSNLSTQNAAETPQGKAENKLAGNSDAEYEQVEGGKYYITGTKSQYRVGRGETIRTIAQLVYGSKGYAPYIIAHNNLKNPDNINAGAVINLPELELR